MEQTSSRTYLIDASFVCIITSLFFMLASAPVFAVNLTACAVVSASGSYTLIENITSSSAKCLDITAKDVTLDCLGNAIRGSDAYGSVGVYSDNDNFALVNCTITDWYIGIQKEGSNNGLIRDSIIRSNSRGISLANSENNRIFNSIITENSQGIYVSFSEGNTIYNNLLNNSNNVAFVGATKNKWNATKQKGIKIYSSGPYIGGNYWSEPGSSYSDSCTDSNGDGFCDSPYTMDDNNIDYLALSNEYVPDTTIPTVKIDSPKPNDILNSTNISITVTANDPVYAYTNISILQGDTILKSVASNQNGTFTVYIKVDNGGYYNITATAYDLEDNSESATATNVLTPLEISSCGASLDVPGEKYLLDRDVSYNGGSICINIQADDITFDCQGRSILGRDATYKTYAISLSNRKNVTVKNCVISDWTYGIFLQSSSGNTIRRCVVGKSKDTGIYVYSSSNNQIYENVFGNSSVYGMRLYSAADNRIYNNLFDNKANVLFEGTILKNYWNTEKKSGLRVYGKGKEIGGNFWTGPQNDFSKGCTDKDTDGMCDEAYDVEASASNPNQGMFILEITGRFLSKIQGLLIGSDSNNIDYLPMSDEFVPDKNPPTTKITVQLPGGSVLNLSEWTRESYVNITFNCSDNASGCLKTLYCYDEYSNCTPWKTYKGPFLIEFEKNLTKTFYLDYMSSDTEGNNETMKVATIRSLSNNQKAVIDSPRDLSYFQSANITLIVRVLKSDELNYTEIVVRNSNGSIVNSTSSTSSTGFTRSIELPSEGTYTLTAMFHSNYSVTSNESSVTVTFDSTSPTITVFNLVPKEKVLLGEKITGSCTANDNDRGIFQGEVSGLDSNSVGIKTATCTATDFAGNRVTDTKSYEVYVINCVEGSRRCNNNNVEICNDNEYTIDTNCDYMCRMQEGTPVCIDDPVGEDTEGDANATTEENENKTGGENPLSNPTLVAAGSFLLLLIAGVMIFLYFKLFQKPKKDFSKRMAIIEAKIGEAESKGKDASAVKSEFELAQADINMGLFEMAEPRLKEIEKSLKNLK